MNKDSVNIKKDWDTVFGILDRCYGYLGHEGFSQVMASELPLGEKHRRVSDTLRLAELVQKEHFLAINSILQFDTELVSLKCLKEKVSQYYGYKDFAEVESLDATKGIETKIMDKVFKLCGFLLDERLIAMDKFVKYKTELLKSLPKSPFERFFNYLGKMF